MKRDHVRTKSVLIPFITLKRRGCADIEIVKNPDITQHPQVASLKAIRQMKEAMPINYSQALFTITHYERGHFLIYDNSQIMAYTIIRV